jgi:hypothetical protein
MPLALTTVRFRGYNGHGDCTARFAYLTDFPGASTAMRGMAERSS